MKKVSLLFASFLLVAIGYGQMAPLENIKKTTALAVLLKKEKRVIYVNHKKNVSLFFPKPIRQGIIGAPHFVFGYNQETPSYLGILKGKYGTESNLLVITTDGQVYSFVIKYTKNLKQYTYFITKEDTIGNENQYKKEEEKKKILKQPLESISENSEYQTTFYNNQLPDTARLLYHRDRMKFYKKFCDNLTSKKEGHIKHKKKSFENVTLHLKDIIYGYNELFFYLEIENNSGVDYDVNFLTISTTNANKRRRKSSQTILKKPIYVYKLYNRVKRKTVDRLVYVLPKFSINNQKKVLIELNELHGERNITLKVPRRMINNPH